MRSLRLVKWLTLSLLVMAVLANPAAGWEEDLAEQIEREHDCKVTFFSGIFERNVEGHKVVRAKVLCNDERSFDAFRPDGSDLFQFTETTNKDAALLSLRRRLWVHNKPVGGLLLVGSSMSLCA